MPVKEIDKVLSRMFRDQAFRDLLRENPERALAGYQLTSQERNALAKYQRRDQAIIQER